MLQLLTQVKDTKLLERFISKILSKEYDGSENESILEAIRLLDDDKVGDLLSQLMNKKVGVFPVECVNLLNLLISGNKLKSQTLQRVACSVGNGGTDEGPDKKTGDDHFIADDPFIKEGDNDGKQHANRAEKVTCRSCAWVCESFQSYDKENCSEEIKKINPFFSHDLFFPLKHL